MKLRLNQLKWYLRAVCNAILDHKMHCTNICDEDAIRFLILRAFQSEAEAILKIWREAELAQLSTYFVGRMAFQRLRRSVQNELGDNFELGRFHEAALDHGSLPVKYLPEVTRERLKRARLTREPSGNPGESRRAEARRPCPKGSWLRPTAAIRVANLAPGSIDLFGNLAHSVFADGLPPIFPQDAAAGIGHHLGQAFFMGRDAFSRLWSVVFFIGFLQE